MTWKRLLVGLIALVAIGFAVVMIRRQQQPVDWSIDVSNAYPPEPGGPVVNSSGASAFSPGKTERKKGE